ncbi:cytochrome-c oxidase [Desulfoluna limicola]|uniref:Cytochrome-c oxidase n=1 Tax=Desulfoluna limicola TaxID=2810562 RepID=A0ABM7PG58_9BACT|nr:SCO family protein [Desulfoluna limicola]BCS96581.1 cytochrome-c oxidase [Desulfoluna limicola]
MRRVLLIGGLSLLLVMVTSSASYSHGEETHGELPVLLAEEEIPVVVGVDEKPGDTLHTDGLWWNERGEQVDLEEVLDLPTIVIPAYYHCPKSCSFLLASMAAAVRDLDLFPAMAYRVVAVSISDDEDATHAATAKTQYFKILGAGYPEEGWSFLVGDKESIDRLCASMGYRFTKKGPHSYIHPNVALAVAPRGKIIRYLYGPDFLTADLKKGMEEAAEGVPRISIHRVVTFCFDYDPKNRGYVLNVYRTMGTVTLTLAGLLFLYLVVAPTVRRSRRR